MATVHNVTVIESNTSSKGAHRIAAHAEGLNPSFEKLGIKVPARISCYTVYPTVEERDATLAALNALKAEGKHRIVIVCQDGKTMGDLDIV